MRVIPRTSVVLPVPGPPVTTTSAEVNAAARAWRCRSARRMPAPASYQATARPTSRLTGGGGGRSIAETRSVTESSARARRGRYTAGSRPGRSRTTAASRSASRSRAVSRSPGVTPEQGPGRLQQPVPRLEDVPLLGGQAEGVEEAGLEPLGGVLGQAEAAGHPVGGQEADPEDLLRQSVGARPDHLHGAGAVASVNAGSDRRGDPVADQEHHDLLQAAVLRPRRTNPLDGLAPDPGHFHEPLGVAVDHRQGVEPEGVHQSLRQLGPDAAHATRREVASHTAQRARVDVDERGDLELLPEAGVLDPTAVEHQLVAVVNAEQRPHRGETAAVVGVAAEDRPAVFLVGEHGVGHGGPDRDLLVATGWLLLTHAAILSLSA